MRSRHCHAAARAAAFLLVTVLLLPPAILAGLISPRMLGWLRKLWCRATMAILSVRVTYEGRAFVDCPTLFVANHVSYLDILALGVRLDATFIAKVEIARWPLFGTLARVASTFFVRRQWREALIQRNTLAARLRLGESFVLFAEGTSTDGLALRPFKTTLLSVAEPWVLDRPVAVQAVTLAYARLADGTPIGPTNCHLYAWYGESEFLPHLLRMLHLDGVQMHVVLHEPVLSWSMQSRKVLGRQLHDQVALGLVLSQERPVAEDPTQDPARTAEAC
jgi:1-acyl-sn-glycerol-3-phosphate acyltransferase